MLELALSSVRILGTGLGCCASARSVLVDFVQWPLEKRLAVARRECRAGLQPLVAESPAVPWGGFVVVLPVGEASLVPPPLGADQRCALAEPRVWFFAARGLRVHGPSRLLVVLWAAHQQPVASWAAGAEGLPPAVALSGSPAKPVCPGA